MFNITRAAAAASPAARPLTSDDASEGPARSPVPEKVSGGGSIFYRYRDESGRLVIVDSLARVPSRAREAVESVVLAPAPGPSVLELPARFAQDLHGPSFLAGVGGTLALGLLWLLLRRGRSRLVRFALLGALVLAGSGAYLGWVRRMAGQGDSLVASPTALIDDARNAVQKMNERSREQQRVLDELTAER